MLLIVNDTECHIIMYGADSGAVLIWSAVARTKCAAAGGFRAD